MAREPIPTWFFALVVVRRRNQFLLVHEAKHGKLWYLPAGRVEPGEALVDGAKRETLEEAGVKIAVEGVLRIEHSPASDSARVRVFFLARPEGDDTPKSIPDEESLEARWVTYDEARKLPLRGGEVLSILRSVEEGHPVAPLSMLVRESDPWP